LVQIYANIKKAILSGKRGRGLVIGLTSGEVLMQVFQIVSKKSLNIPKR